MRWCGYCGKDINHKHRQALYCDWKCGEHYRERGMIQIAEDNIKWSKIGLNSSYAAMMEVHKMLNPKNKVFKNVPS